jgi:hypothetical protein
MCAERTVIEIDFVPYLVASVCEMQTVPGSISRRIKLEQINDGFAAPKSGAPVRQLIDFAV